MKNGELRECHYEPADRHLKNLFNLWKASDLNFTPKVHSILAHALEQAKVFQGIGDTLEDDIEHMHQISARIESRISRMKNKEQQAFVHSRMEAIQCNVQVSEIIEERKIEAKRKMNTVHNAESRAKRLKEERDDR